MHAMEAYMAQREQVDHEQVEATEAVRVSSPSPAIHSREYNEPSPREEDIH